MHVYLTQHCFFLHCHTCQLEFKLPLPPAKKQKNLACIREIQVHKLWTKVYSQMGLTAMWSNMVRGCMVYTERATTAAVSHATSHVSAVKYTTLMDIQKHATKSCSFTVSLLTTREQRYIKVINNNVLTQPVASFLCQPGQFCQWPPPSSPASGHFCSSPVNRDPSCQRCRQTNLTTDKTATKWP